jgi:hypothetical protein
VARVIKKGVTNMKDYTIAGSALALVALAGVAAYLLWCPESPRFDDKPWRREWWQRQRYHATHR